MNVFHLTYLQRHNWIEPISLHHRHSVMALWKNGVIRFGNNSMTSEFWRQLPIVLNDDPRVITRRTWMRNTSWSSRATVLTGMVTTGCDAWPRQSAQLQRRLGRVANNAGLVNEQGKAFPCYLPSPPVVVIRYWMQTIGNDHNSRMNRRTTLLAADSHARPATKQPRCNFHFLNLHLWE